MKDNHHYCQRFDRYIHLCRIHMCEYWQDCYKVFVDIGYELVPANPKNNIGGLKWKRKK